MGLSPWLALLRPEDPKPRIGYKTKLYLGKNSFGGVGGGLGGGGRRWTSIDQRSRDYSEFGQLHLSLK